MNRVLMISLFFLVACSDETTPEPADPLAETGTKTDSVEIENKLIGTWKMDSIHVQYDDVFHPAHVPDDTIIAVYHKDGTYETIKNKDTTSGKWWFEKEFLNFETPEEPAVEWPSRFIINQLDEEHLWLIKLIVIDSSVTEISTYHTRVN